MRRLAVFLSFPFHTIWVLVLCLGIEAGLAKGASHQSPHLSQKSNLKPIQALTDNDMEMLKNPAANWLLMFHADWCPACQGFKPTFHEVAQWVLDSKLPLKVGLIDYTVNPNGTTREVSTYRADLKRMIHDDSWRSVAPVSKFRSPFSPLNTILSYLGLVGYKLIKVAEKASASSTLSPPLVIGFTFLAMLGAAFFLTLRTSSKDEAANEDKPNEKANGRPNGKIDEKIDKKTDEKVNDKKPPSSAPTHPKPE